MAEGFWDSVVTGLKKKLNAKSITKESHPEFYSSVEELAKKAGVRMPEILYAEEIPVGPIWTRKLPNAAAAPGANAVIINKAMLDNTNSSLSSKVSAELEAVFAHEFSHLKDGWAKLVAGRSVPFVLPVVSMAALYLLKRAHDKKDPKKIESEKELAIKLKEKVDLIAAGEKEEAEKVSHRIDELELHPGWKKYVITAAQYTVAAAIGLAAGLTFSRYSSLASEFRADKFAVEITQKPETFKRMLTSLHESRGVKLNTSEDTLKEAMKHADGFYNKVKEALHWIMKKTIHAHPTLEQRLSHVDKLVQNGTGGMPLR